MCAVFRIFEKITCVQQKVAVTENKIVRNFVGVQSYAHVKNLRIFFKNII